jgi:NAD(P)-dependent dehydrogenase (short-subunit alcohol dehydrogenase family)
MPSERAVLITGASTGIGEACALQLDRLGFRVFAGVRKEADGDRLRRQASGILQPVRIDITRIDEVAAAAETIQAAAGDAGLAGLVNNAGIVVAGPLEFVPLEEIRRQLEVNVIGHIAVTQAFLPLLRQGHGRIVNIGSTSGRLSTPYLGPYCASKFALEALTDSLRMELRPWDISVSIVDPGNVQTPIWEKSAAAAEQLIGKLPEQAHRLYDPGIAAIQQAAAEEARTAIPAGFVASAVVEALTARKPRTRYYVGKQAKAAALLARFVPDRVLDSLILRHLQLPGS